MSDNSFVAPALPHSVEAERAILGAILLGGGGTEDAVSRIQESDFFIPSHQVIFRNLKALREAGSPTNDLVLLYDSLRSRGELEAAGGIAYLSQLPEELPRRANLDYYIGIILLNSQLRSRANVAQRILTLVLGPNGNSAEILREISILSAPLRDEVGQKRKLRFMSGAELAGSTDEAVEWIVPGYVARGAISEIGAKVKAGKTTLIAALVRAAADGEDFLGFPTLKSSTVYLTEQPAVSFRQTLARAGLLGRSDFHLLLRSDVPQISWPEVVAAAVDECKRVGAKLLVIDTLPQFAGLPGDSENNSGDALAAMQPLQHAVALGIAVIWVRHDRKAGGDVGDSGRGSTAFGGVSDILISLRNPEGKIKRNVRILKAKSRFAETPAELVIELTEKGFVALGDSQCGAVKEAKEATVAVVPISEAEAMTVKELAKLVEIPRTTLQRCLEELVAEGNIVRVGDGKRASPFQYFALRNRICPTSPLKGQEGNVNRPEPGAEPK
jgi:hypothetical protein